MTEDREKAVALSEAAFSAGVVDRVFQLSVMYETGDGCSKDAYKAFLYAQKGAAGGDADSACQLSRCYRYGIGTEIDLSKADAYLVQALDARSKRAWTMWNADGASELDCRVRWAGEDETRWHLVLQHAQLHWKEFGYVSLCRKSAALGFGPARDELVKWNSEL